MKKNCVSGWLFTKFIYFLFVAFVAVTIAGFFSGTGIEACLEV